MRISLAIINHCEQLFSEILFFIGIGCCNHFLTNNFLRDLQKEEFSVSLSSFIVYFWVIESYKVSIPLNAPPSTNLWFNRIDMESISSLIGRRRLKVNKFTVPPFSSTDRQPINKLQRRLCTDPLIGCHGDKQLIIII